MCVCVLCARWSSKREVLTIMGLNQVFLCDENIASFCWLNSFSSSEISYHAINVGKCILTLVSDHNDVSWLKRMCSEKEIKQIVASSYSKCLLFLICWNRIPLTARFVTKKNKKANNFKSYSISHPLKLDCIFFNHFHHSEELSVYIVVFPHSYSFGMRKMAQFKCHCSAYLHKPHSLSHTQSHSYTHLG